MGRVGSIVESPQFFPAFSGRKNLQLLAEAIDRPRGIVDQVLEQTALGERGKDRYRTYSLGMKQRLAIAATLLKEPDLLIFDEPTNGLDPAGIREIRNTMRSLGEQGKPSWSAATSSTRSSRSLTRSRSSATAGCWPRVGSPT